MNHILLKKRIRNGSIALARKIDYGGRQRARLRRARRSLARVVCYHRISGEQIRIFRQQLTFLRRRFDVLPLSKIPNHLGRTGRDLLAVTFDDCHQDFMSNALPALEAQDVPVTLFVPTAILDLDAEGRYNFAAERIGIAGPLLSGDEIRRLDTHPLIDFGSHSHSHADLGQKLSLKAMFDETCGSISRLERHLQHAISDFAYPFGDITNHCHRSRQMLTKCATHAYSIVPGFWHTAADPLTIGRDSLDPGAPVSRIADWMNGHYDGLKSISNWIRTRI